MRSRHLLPLVLVLLVGAGCSDDDDGLSPDNAAFVQFVNASPTGPVSTSVASQTTGPTLAFGQSSTTCTLVQPGASVQFSSGGTQVASANTGQFVAGQRYLVILRGSGTSRTIVTLPEVLTQQTAGLYGARFINLTDASGDIYVTTPTGTISGSPSASLSSGSVTGGTLGANGFITFPTSTTRVRFFAAGTTTPVLSDMTLTPPSGGTITVVFANATNGVTGIVVDPCSV